MAAKRAPNRFYNLQRRFCCRLGVLFGGSRRFPLGRSVHGQRVSATPTWKENIAFAKAQSPVVVVFSVFFFLFCCRIEEKDGSSCSLCWRALFCAAVTPASLSATVQRRWLLVWIGRNCCSRYVECYRVLIPNLCGNTLFNVGFLGFQHGVFGHP